MVVEAVLEVVVEAVVAAVEEGGAEIDSNLSDTFFLKFSGDLRPRLSE